MNKGKMMCEGSHGRDEAVACFSVIIATTCDIVISNTCDHVTAITYPLHHTE